MDTIPEGRRLIVVATDTTSVTPFHAVITARSALVHARDAMVENKNTAAALAYCYAVTQLRAALAAMPKLQLVRPSE